MPTLGSKACLLVFYLVCCSACWRWQAHCHVSKYTVVMSKHDLALLGWFNRLTLPYIWPSPLLPFFLQKRNNQQLRPVFASADPDSFAHDINHVTYVLESRLRYSDASRFSILQCSHTLPPFSAGVACLAGPFVFKVFEIINTPVKFFFPVWWSICQTAQYSIQRLWWPLFL